MDYEQGLNFIFNVMYKDYSNEMKSLKLPAGYEHLPPHLALEKADNQKKKKYLNFY